MKLMMTPNRRCMDPSTIVALLFLRYNSDLWREADIELIQREIKAEAAAARQIREVGTTDTPLAFVDSGDGTWVSELGSSPSSGFRT